MEPAIVIENLFKHYRKGAAAAPYVSLRDTLTNALKKKKQRESERYFWALQNVNLQIERGERIGIIGRNGAGKSTLLKIISRITPPTKGRIVFEGRVASLLEVGTGFHPELTGRENIYLNGSILGLKKTEITNKLDEIISFSGVENFLDTPLKHYSTGMQLRLAFSVAAHLEPEILLIDEVLAVGDAEFQKKCMSKMQDVSRKDGRTIVFVSHNLPAISTLTQKTILLNEGKVVCFEKTTDALSAYLQSSTIKTDVVAPATGDTPVIHQVQVETSEGGDIQAHGKPLSVTFDIYMPEANVKNMALAFQVMHRQLEQPVFHQWLFDSDSPQFRTKGINRVKFEFPIIKLYKGDYYLRVHLAESKNKIKFAEAECCPFTVEMLSMPQPDWGWYDNMCLYLENGKWQQIVTHD